MSHVTESTTKVVDLDALEKAVVDLGGTFHRGQTQAAWWGSFVDDSTAWRSMFTEEEAARIAALPKAERQAIIEKEMARCDHAISFPGCRYEIGVTQTEDGRFRLRYDEYDGGLVEKVGKNAGKLIKHYGVHRAVKEAQKARLRTKQVVMSDGSIKLIVEGV